MLNSALTKFNVLPPRPIDNLNGLVTWWTFDDGAAIDQSGFQNNGTLVNAPALKEGILGKSLSFNGSNNYVIGSRIINVSVVSLSLWFKSVSIPGGNPGLIAGFVNGLGSGVTDKVLAYGAAGVVSWYVSDGGSKFAVSLSSYTDGKWHHLCGTADGVVSKLYIDGALNISVAAGNTYAGYTVPNLFVNGASGQNTYCQDQVDDVRVYNRAISAAEINAIYNQGIAYQQGYPENEMGALRVPATLYSLSGVPGSFLLSGASASTPGARKLSAATVSFAISGNAAPGAAKRKLTAGAGAFSLSGQTVAATASRVIAAASGSFALTGHSAVPSRGVALLETPGGFALNGAPTLAPIVRELLAGTGSLAVIGQSGNGQLARKLPASSGGFAMSGSSVALPIAHKALADTGEFSLSGRLSTGSLAHFLGLVTGSFGLGSSPASLAREIVLGGLPGLFMLAGDDAELTVLHRTLHPKRRLISLTGSVSATALLAAKPTAGITGAKLSIIITGSDT